MPSSIGSPPEVPCVRCHARVAGLAWGARCPPCHAERGRRAGRVARRVALLAALVAATGLGLTMPASDSSRIWIGGGSVAAFLLARVIAHRAAMDLLPD